MTDGNNNLILFISGVPSAGKTTISYELLREIDYFRIVQETDILREILRGYNTYLSQEVSEILSDLTEPAPHTELLSYERAKIQCTIMKKSIIEIVKRQNRKCIPTIICGVHIIPEILYNNIPGNNIKYVNLYFDCEEDLYSHLRIRNHDKYGKKSVSFLFEMNSELQDNFSFMQSKNPSTFISINVGKLTIKETVTAIIDFLQQQQSIC
ncbi:MAG: hypothetical protein GX235_07285 [Clostridiales bacterium]|nr:hypothetical protein [Clostridiales bacterium]